MAVGRPHRAHRHRCIASGSSPLSRPGLPAMNHRQSRIRSKNRSKIRFHQAVGTINPELCDSALEMSSFPRGGSLACPGKLNPQHQASQPGKDSRSQNYLRWYEQAYQRWGWRAWHETPSSTLNPPPGSAAFKKEALYWVIQLFPGVKFNRK